MKEQHMSTHLPRPVVFMTRPCRVVSCPICWTDQHASRDCCWYCGAPFRYLDEALPQEREKQEKALAACE